MKTVVSILKPGVALKVIRGFEPLEHVSRQDFYAPYIPEER